MQAKEYAKTRFCCKRVPIAHLFQHTATQSVVGDRLEARPSLSHALQFTLQQRTALHVEGDAAAIEKHAELQDSFIVSFYNGHAMKGELPLRKQRARKGELPLRRQRGVRACKCGGRGAWLL